MSTITVKKDLKTITLTKGTKKLVIKTLRASGNGGAATLQEAYNGGADIVTGANGPVVLSRADVDAQAALSISRVPTAASVGAAIVVAMGALAAGPAIEITNLGSGPELKWGASKIHGGSLYLEEKVAALADAPGAGQFWVKDDGDAYFTTKAGVDHQLNGLASLAGSTYSTHQDARNALGSTGVISGGSITDDTDGTITVSAGTGLIRAINDSFATIYNCDWAAESGVNVTLADNAMNWVYVEYNAGSPRVVARAVKSSDEHTNFLLGSVYRIGTVLHISEQNHKHLNDHLTLVTERLTQTRPFERGDGGIISETGVRSFALTAGTWWQGVDSFTSAAFDSSGTDTFIYLHRDGIGGWTATTGQSQISNTLYDDGDGTLGALGNNRYGVHWVFIGQDGDRYVVYGRGDYLLAGAQDAAIPADLPPWFDEDHTRVVGKIIIKKDDAAFTSFETPFDVSFIGSIATDHGSLIGLADDDHLQYLRIDGTRAMTGALSIVSGTQALPGLSLAVDPATGIFGALNVLALSAAGTYAMEIRASQVRSRIAHVFGDGNEAAPGIAFNAGPGTGIRRVTTDTMGFSTGSIEAMRLDSSQNQRNSGKIWVNTSIDSPNTAVPLYIDAQSVTNVPCIQVVGVGNGTGGISMASSSGSLLRFGDLLNMGVGAKHGVYSANRGFGIWVNSDAYDPTSTESIIFKTGGRLTKAALAVQVAASHTGSFQEWRDSTGAALTKVTSTGTIEAAADTDGSFVFGKMRIDSRISDYAMFSHYDRSGVLEYALRHSTAGQTVVSGTSVVLAINGITSFSIVAGGLESSAPNGGSVRNENATSTNPTLIPDRGDLTSGVSHGSVLGEVSIITDGIEAVQWDASQNQINAGNILTSLTTGPMIVNEGASGINPTLIPNRGSASSGIGANIAGVVSMIANAVEALRADTSAIAGNTRLMIYDVDNATLERVTVGAADSGGVGFKLLRIPN